MKIWTAILALTLVAASVDAEPAAPRHHPRSGDRLSRGELRLRHHPGQGPGRRSVGRPRGR